MYVILVYDVGEARVTKVCNFLRTFLPRVQNSVFEGQTSEAKLARMKAGLAKILVPDEDAVLLWVLRDAKWADRQVLGHERFPVSNVL
jgi:CRISPR-associated protein Cas2